MTLPMIVGIVSILLFNLADSYFISLLGTKELAAFGFTFPVTMLMINLAVGLSIGTSALVARALGSGDHQQSQNLTLASLMLAAIVGVSFSILGIFTIEPVFTMLGASAELIPIISSYMLLWYIGIVFLIMPIVGNSAIRASGNTKFPSMLMALSAVLNAIVDPLLIFGIGPFPEMGMRGAAVSTLFSWSFTMILGMWFLTKKEKLLVLEWLPWRDLKQYWRRHLSISLPASLANILVPVATAILTYLVAGYGEPAVAAFGVGMRIEGLALVVILAMTMAFPPFISQNLGAGQLDRIRKALRIGISFAFVFELLVYVILWLSGTSIANIFSVEPAVVNLIILFLLILPLSYGCQGMVILSVSSLSALHRSRTALLISVIRLFVCYVPLAYIGLQLFELHGLFIGAALGNAIAAAIAIIILYRSLDQVEQQLKTN